MSKDLTNNPDQAGASSPEVRADPAHGASETASGHDTHDPHDIHDAPDSGHGGGGHGSHGDDTSDAPTLVPTTFSQLILPAIILLIVAVLVAGPVINAFSSKPASSAPAQGQAAESSSAPQNQAVLSPSPTTGPAAPTSTTAPTEAPATPTTSASLDLPRIATQTAVAIAGEQGEVARVPIKLEFGGASFLVTQGSGLLPDWTPSQDAGIATWINGTVANHILYVPFNDQNEALFKAAKSGDLIKLQMNTGQIFTFEVNRAERATNGPETREGQFTVATAMAQNHAGVTLFLTGDPANDRAVVQADFTGNIQ